MTLQPDNLRRPIIWYLGHTGVFYINKLKLANFQICLNEWFENFFAVGVDPVSPEELDTENYIKNMPKIQEVKLFFLKSLIKKK